MKKEIFRRLVAEALDSLPDLFREKMENVEVIVEDFPDRETLDSLELTSRWDLLGLYVGVPLPNQGFFNTNVLPERIYLYRRPILRAAYDRDEAVAMIRETLVHEVGHHFGFTDEELDAMLEHQE